MAQIELVDVGESALLARFTASTGSKNQFIFGRDGDGRPFMTQVTTKLQTIEEAFDYLKPKLVKEAIAQGLDVKRQGDWFFIPVQKSFSRHSYQPDGYSNLEGRYMANELVPGVLYSGDFFQETRHTVRGEIFYRCNGHHYVMGTVQAPDHPPLVLGEQWHLAVRTKAHPWWNENRRRGDD